MTTCPRCGMEHPLDDLFGHIALCLDIPDQPFVVPVVVILGQADIREVRLAEQIVFDRNALILRIGGSEQRLTGREGLLLRHFVDNPRRVLTRAQLLVAVWGDNRIVNQREVDTYVHRIRERLRFTPDGRRLIITVRDIGYAYNPSALNVDEIP